MNGVDPMASKYASYSPYNYSFNNPVGFNDPSGADPDYWKEESVSRKRILSLGAAYSSHNSVYGTNSSDNWSSIFDDITPGSGGNWADGFRYDDWSPNDGSSIYRNGISTGYTDMGGVLYNPGNGTYVAGNGDVKV